MQYLKSIHTFFLVTSAALFHLILCEDCPENDNYCTCTPLNENDYAAECRGYLPLTLSRKIKKVTMTGNYLLLDKIDTVGFENVEVLNMTNCSIGIIENAFSKVNKFKKLILSQNQLESIQQSTFPSLINLEELHLDYNRIQFIEEKSFKSLTRLTLLNLMHNSLKEIHFISSLPESLTFLDLSHNTIVSLPTLRQHNMTFLDLCGNEIQEVTGLFKFKMLKYLCLSGLKYLPIDGLSPSIEHLSITGNRNSLTEMSTSISATIEKMTNISILHIESFVVTSFGFFQNLTKLQRLSLVSVEPGDSARIENVFKHKKSLQYLDLSNSSILAEQVLKRFNRIPGVTFLRLHHTGIKSLQGYSSLLYLEHIDISRNPLNCSYENWKWLDNIKDVKSYLINWQDLLCSYPENYKGILLHILIDQKHRTTPEEPQQNISNPQEYTIHKDEIEESIKILIYGGIVIITLMSIIMYIMYKKLNSYEKVDNTLAVIEMNQRDSTSS